MAQFKYKTKWDLSSLKPKDTQAYLKKHSEQTYKFINKWSSREDYLKDPKAMKEALDEYEAWQRNWSDDGEIGYYYFLLRTLKQDDSKVKAEHNKIHSYAVKIVNDIQFFELRIARIPIGLQKEFLSNKELKDYKHFLEQLFRDAKYLLSEPEEKILNLNSKTSYSNWVNMTSEFISKEEREIKDAKGKKSKKSFNEIISLTSDKNKKVRDEASKLLNEIFEKHIDTAVTEINSVLEYKKVNDELRGLPRPDLSRHLGDDIESETVDALIEAVRSTNKIAKKYYELKAKLFGVKKLQYHERNLEYGNVDKKYSFETSVDLVYDVFKKLDKDFADIFKKFLVEGRVDVFPSKSKRGGAFCSHNRLIDPTHIMLNHTDQLTDVTTLAHEMGHGIHFELGKLKQNSLNFRFPVSIAEVASTFMEDFVFEELLGEANAEDKLSLIISKLNGDISTIHRQIACYLFEADLHKNYREKGYLSADDIGKIFQKNMKAYMGEAVEQSEGSQNWWVYWSHIRSFFYVYSYASGILISKSLQNSVKKDAKFIEKVKTFLEAANFESPSKVFENIGIDIKDKAFWLKGLREVEKLVDEAEGLAKKLKKFNDK